MPLRSAITSPRPREQTAPNLGACLRQLRFKRRMSIAEVSAATGIAKSTLSRVENDQLSLTYAKLLQLCKGLQIDIAELLSDGMSREIVQPSARRTFTARGAGRPMIIGTQGYNYLCTDLAGKNMTPMTGDIHSRTLQETNGLLKHDGEEFTFVLEGRMALYTEFYEPLLLDVGGSVYFDSTMGHAYVSVGSVPLKILCVCTTPEPGLHAPDDRGSEGLGQAGALKSSSAVEPSRKRTPPKPRGRSSNAVRRVRC